MSINCKAVDLFCGIGGLSYGLKKAGINVVAGIDLDESCKYAYEANNAPFINKSVAEITSIELKKLFGGSEIKILVGCAPCQTFSKHTLKVRDRKNSDKWRLLDDFSEKISKIKPEIVSMENVPQLTKYDVYSDFIKVLEDQKYHISSDIIYCPDYGIPQNRSRLVLMASLLGPIKIIPNTHTVDSYKTVKDSIYNLDKIKAGIKLNKDPLHISASLSDLNYRRIKKSKPGGSWKEWDSDLRVNCHKKETGKTYSSVYGRMEWDKPSPTITTQFYSYGTGRFGHPEQNRALSLREGALLQTFPKSYKFIPSGEEVLIRPIARHIGNAVPVKLGEIIGKSIIKHLEDYYAG